MKHWAPHGPQHVVQLSKHDRCLAKTAREGSGNPNFAIHEIRVDLKEWVEILLSLVLEHPKSFWWSLRPLLGRFVHAVAPSLAGAGDKGPGSNMLLSRFANCRSFIYKSEPTCPQWYLDKEPPPEAACSSTRLSVHSCAPWWWTRRSGPHHQWRDSRLGTHPTTSSNTAGVNSVQSGSCLPKRAARPEDGAHLTNLGQSKEIGWSPWTLCSFHLRGHTFHSETTFPLRLHLGHWARTRRNVAPAVASTVTFNPIAEEHSEIASIFQNPEALQSCFALLVFVDINGNILCVFTTCMNTVVRLLRWWPNRRLRRHLATFGDLQLKLHRVATTRLQLGHQKLHPMPFSQGNLMAFRSVLSNQATLGALAQSAHPQLDPKFRLHLSVGLPSSSSEKIHPADCRLNSAHQIHYHAMKTPQRN